MFHCVLDIQVLKGFLVTDIAGMVIAIIIQAFFHGLFVAFNHFSITISIRHTLVVIGMTEFVKNNAACRKNKGNGSNA